MSSVDPNWSADCHASGTVQYLVTAVRGDAMLKLCGHCLVAPRQNGPTHLDALTEQGWDIHAAKRPFNWFGAGTEGTPPHFALDTF